MRETPDSGTILTWVTKGIGGLTAIVDGLTQSGLRPSQGQADQISQAASDLSDAVERLTLTLSE